MNHPETYRKKPVEVEALLWDGNLRTAINFIDDEFSVDDNTRSLYIPTLEGEMECRLGDWLVKGTRGEYYPVKPEPFSDTFEQVS